MTGDESTSLRGIAKRLLEQGVTRSRLDRVSRTLRDARGAVLAYHNVVPDGTEPRGEAALHLPRSRFAKHLDAIARTHDVVSLDRLLTGEPDSGRPQVAITFDDAYRGAVTAGLEETGKRGFPVTVFVAPGLLGRDAFWWDRLADGDGRIDPAVRKAALFEEGGDQEAILERWSPAPGPSGGTVAPLPDAYRPCSGEELEAALVDRPDVSVGSHTWSHRCLPESGEETVRTELERADRWLRSRFEERYVSCISYPYGRTSRDVVNVARRTYRWALRIEGGLVSRSGDGDADYTVPRINVPRGVSERGLLLRLSGLL